jgi:class 3 adenylate cyclase/alpha-beta hydrolase superfamily lysophospholipase
VQAPETHYVRRSDGVSIGYQVFGEGPVDLVCVPGCCSHLDLQWTDPGNARFLRRLGKFARVVCYDKPGTGLSDPIARPPTVEERADDLKHVLEAAGCERPALFGFSEGWATCALLAAAEPARVSSLILYGAFGRVTECPPELSPAECDALNGQNAQVWSALYETTEHWGEGHWGALVAPSAASPAQRQFLAAFERAAVSPGLMHALLDSMQTIDLPDTLAAISAPTLVLHRYDDGVPVAFARLLAARIPGAELVVLPGEDHLFWCGDVDSIVDEIESFMTGARTAREPERAVATILFTDIARSTERAAELGDRRWRDLLERYDSVVRDQVRQFDGRVVKSLGDGALAVFDGPARAVACAEEIRHELGGVGISARFGIHTGECEMIGDDVGGMAVHITARVMGFAKADEILVSSTVADLVVGSNLAFEERGRHTLKGVPGKWRLLAVDHERRKTPRHTPAARPREAVPPSNGSAGPLLRRASQAMRAAVKLDRRPTA